LRAGGCDATIGCSASGGLAPTFSKVTPDFSESPGIPGAAVVRTGSVMDRSTGNRVVDWSESLSGFGMSARIA